MKKKNASSSGLFRSSLVIRPQIYGVNFHGYNEKSFDHYENPRNAGSFAKDETDVGTGMVGAPACGDVMKLQIKV